MVVVAHALNESAVCTVMYVHVWYAMYAHCNVWRGRHGAISVHVVHLVQLRCTRSVMVQLLYVRIIVQ